MSDDDTQSDREVTSEGYQVGYGKPPIGSRFKKGESGNLKGRPKGTKKSLVPVSPTGLPSSSVILDLAYTSVTLRNGDKITDIPMIKAILMAQMKAATDGNRLAAKWIVDLVRAEEERMRDVEARFTEQVFAYLRHCDEAAALALQRGRQVPEFPLDPNGFFVDPETGKLGFDGAAPWQKLIALCERLRTAADVAARELKQSTVADDRAFWLSEWRYSHDHFQKFNQMLPKLYRVDPPDRLYLDEHGQPIGLPPLEPDRSDGDDQAAPLASARSRLVSLLLTRSEVAIEHDGNDREHGARQSEHDRVVSPFNCVPDT